MTYPPGSTAAAGSPRIGLASAERDHGVIARREKEQFSFHGELDCIRPHRSGRGLARSGGWTVVGNIRVSQPLSTANRKNPYSWFDRCRVVDGRHVQWFDSPCPWLASRDEGLAHGPVVRIRSTSAPPQTAVGCGVPTEFCSCVIPAIPAPLLAVPVAGNGMSATAVSPAAWLEAPTDESFGQKSTRDRQTPSTVRSNAPLARLCECGIT